ncbi:Flp pilus assembly protein CpaB [Thiomicrospira microaerophila]|uniref:Flp pilus assembly protein CpaB n=1 Tax=Thiomicrospira microaerophila TaxID=406020 RepID=UPI00200C2642|nr:Flp pilus assembly protein CpaB [Thiomicrospira microaerophila]UQB43065.1 Flp pilus assembly protein CpaB [Thiomicrospira microaerophila]
MMFKPHTRRQITSTYILATLVAIIVVFLVYFYTEQRVTQALSERPVETVIVVEQPEMAKLVVSARDLLRGHKLQAEDIKTIELPKIAITRAGIFEQPDGLIGLTLNRDIFAEEWLINRHLVELSQEDPSIQFKNFSQTLEPGMRAVRVPVTSQTGLLGLIRVGDFVDIVSVFEDPSEKSLYSRTILQNVEVLRIGQAKPGSSDSAEGYSDTERSLLTLKLSLDEAEMVNLALVSGRLSMTLRNPGDIDEVTTSGQRLADLVDSQATKPPVKQQADMDSINPGRVVQVITRGKLEEVVIQ